MDLLAQAGPQMNQLRSMPHQLAQLAGRRWGDPPLGQAIHPQQVGQISGVTFVVLHPSVGEAFHSQRVGQVHVSAELSQRIGGPVPAVGRFQHDLG